MKVKQSRNVIKVHLSKKKAFFATSFNVSIISLLVESFLEFGLKKEIYRTKKVTLLDKRPTQTDNSLQ
jgi:hypothetical protein